MIILLLTPIKLYPLEGFVQESNSVKLQSGYVTVTVDSNSDKNEWNSYTQRKTEDFLKALETYVRAEFPGPDSFIVKGRDNIYYEDPNSENYGKRVGGANFWDYIGIEYELSQVGSPALLLHEIAHYYFGYPLDLSDFEVSWLIEGLVSYLPIAMVDSGILKLGSDEYNSIFSHWGFYNSDIDKGRPLIVDFRWESSDLFSRFYMKSFKIVHILYKELGTSSFRSFVVDLYHQKAKVEKMDELVELLSKYKRTDWNGILSGWVFEGNFARKELTGFVDSDSDTLLDIDEYYGGTNPNSSDSDGDLLPDNYEIENGFNPLKHDSKKKAIDIINSNGPFMDGIGEDWEYLPYFYSVERVSEPGSSKIDMSSLKIYQSEKGVYILVEVAGVIEKVENTFFDILIDLSGNKIADLEYATYLDQNYAWVYNHEAASSTVYNEIKRGVNKVAEMFIPKELISYETFSILPIFHNATGSFNFDEWDFWININQKHLNGIKTYSLKTNLKSDDSDGDLIPDIYELQNGLDPVKKDNMKKVVEIGPFLDGVGSEWGFFDVKMLKNRRSNSNYLIKDIQSVIKNGNLYIKVGIETPDNINEDVMFDILIDGNGDKRHDYEVAYMLHNPNYNWLYFVDEKRSENFNSVILQRGEVIEVKIPISLIPYKNLSLLPIIRDIKKNINYDELFEWYNVE